MGTEVCCSLFTVRRSVWSSGFGVRSLGSEFCILSSQFYLLSSVESVDRIRKTLLHVYSLFVRTYGNSKLCTSVANYYFFDRKISRSQMKKL